MLEQHIVVYLPMGEVSFIGGKYEQSRSNQKKCLIQFTFQISCLV